MWILPSQLLNSAPGMAALDLDSKTSLASECEPSHIVSLRGSLKPISSVKWKKDSWMSHLFGTILKPSHTESFTDWWIFSLLDIHVNHFPAQESEQEKKTQDISGLGLQTEFDFFNQECASLKMSKDTFRWDSPQSSAIWKNWVTKVRSEYSVRVKLAQSTSASACSSWPTIRVKQGEDCASERRRRNPSLDSIVKQELEHGLHAPANWPTPNCMDVITPTRDLTNMESKGHWGKQPRNRPDGVGFIAPNTGKLSEMVKYGQAAPANHSTDGSRQGWLTPTAQDSKHSGTNPTANGERDLLVNQVNWRTPSSSDGEGGVMEMREGCAGKYKLRDHVVAEQKQWATPNAFDWNQPETMEQWKKRAEVQAQKGVNLHMPLKSQVTPISLSAKLNQRWVETLMGIPMGWTSPSCPASVIRNWPKFVSGWLKATTEQTSFDPAEMELFQLQRSERSES